ncbi:MAG: cytochrome c [Proteobacteria bacterium]|nr:cytochrome c [Pseudomonadota bacterium]
MDRNEIRHVVLLAVAILLISPIMILNSQAGQNINNTYTEPFNHVFKPDSGKQEIILVLSQEEDQGKPESSANNSDNAYSNNKEAIERGGITYSGNCGLCHNGGGVGGKCPQLIRGAWAPDGPNSDRVMFDIISNGRKGTAMGAFKKHLSEQQIREIIAYLRNEAKKYAEKQKNEPEEEGFRR